MTGRKLLGAALLPLVLFGCGGGGSSTPVTEDDFCTQLAAAECQVSDRCVVNVDDCKTARKAACRAFATAAKASTTRTFNTGNIGDCVSQTNSLYGQTAPITPTQLANVQNTCNYVFQGMVKNLDACTVNYDCADRNNICDKGHCAAKVTKNSAGDQCSNFGDVCNTGLICTTTGGVTQCAAKGASSAACSADAPCLETLRCLNGTCTDRVAAQAGCLTNDDCVSTAPYCDPAAGMRCDPGLSFSASSPSCCAFGGTGASCSTGTGGAGGTTGSAGAGGTTGSAGAGGTTGSAGAGGTTGTGGGNQDAAAGG
jgi:hypothetical protein